MIFHPRQLILTHKRYERSGCAHESKQTALHVPSLRHELQTSLSAFDLRLPAGGRFEQYLKHLETSDSITPGLWDFHSQIEIEQLRVILRYPVTSEFQAWRQKLLRVVRGGSIRGRESKDDPSRDLQFELLVAAMVTRSGYVVHIEEPDLWVDTPGGDSFAVAAKRIRASRNSAKQLARARAQIKRQARVGMIFVDGTDCLQDIKGPLSIRPPSDARDAIRRIVRRYSDFCMASVRRGRVPSQLIGIVVTMQFPLILKGTLSPRSHWEGTPVSDENLGTLNEFMDHFECSPFVVPQDCGSTRG